MSLVMPDLDQAVLDRRAQIVSALRGIVPGEGVIDSAAEMKPYESDGLTAYRAMPMVVVLPEQSSRCRKSCAIATAKRSRSYRAAPALRFRVARYRFKMACS